MNDFLPKMSVNRTLQFLRRVDAEGVWKGDSSLGHARVNDGQFSGDTTSIFEENIFESLNG